MDGFKDSTKTKYSAGGSCATGYAKGGPAKGVVKITKVMGEFKAGSLHSGSKTGPEVTNPKQATAIALSEARKAGAKIPVQKKSLGGVMKALSPVAAMAGGDVPALGALGIIQQLLKKRQSGGVLTPAEQRQVATAAPVVPAAAKKGGLMKKGVPVAPKGPMVGLASMPRGKK